MTKNKILLFLVLVFILTSSYFYFYSPQSGVDNINTVEQKTAILEEKDLVIPDHTERLMSKVLQNCQDEESQPLLINLLYLVNNFFQDKDYSQELESFQGLALSESGRTLLEDLKHYNNHYVLERVQGSKRIFPIELDFLEKFLKIERVAPTLEAKLQLRSAISNRLNHFILEISDYDLND